MNAIFPYNEQRICFAYSRYCIIPMEYPIQLPLPTIPIIVVTKDWSVMLGNEIFASINIWNYTIFIESDWDEHEVKDTGKAIVTIDKILTKILNGEDISKGFAKALVMAKQDSIRSFAANYS